MDQPSHVVFEVDLTSHEMRRRTEILRALGPEWDPVAVLRDEEQAYALLYSGLDPAQQEIYDMLAWEGVLAVRDDEHPAA
jgi:hypothetical protein